MPLIREMASREFDTWLNRDGNRKYASVIARLVPTHGSSPKTSSQSPPDDSLEGELARTASMLAGDPQSGHQLRAILVEMLMGVANPKEL